MKKCNGNGHESSTGARSGMEAGTRVKEKTSYPSHDQYGLRQNDILYKFSGAYGLMDT
jgi:hypothetical protein